MHTRELSIAKLAWCGLSEWWWGGSAEVRLLNAAWHLLGAAASREDPSSSGISFSSG